METTSAFRLIFLVYTVIVLYIGWRNWRKRAAYSGDNDIFWSAGKKLSAWSVGFSISAGMMSISWSCVYGVQLFYWYGPGAVWLLIIPWLTILFLLFFLSPLFRKNRVFSQPALLAQKFGRRSRVFLAPVLFVVFLIWGGAEIFAAGQILAAFLDMPQEAVYVIISLVVAAYSFAGGFSAVISTDKLQFFLVALFISGIAWIAFSALPEDTTLLSAAIEAPKAVNNNPWLSPGWPLIIMTFFAYLPGWVVETDLWVRIQAANSDKAAKGGVLIAALNSLLFVGIMPFIIGVAALIIYPAVDGSIPPALQDGALIFNTLLQDFAAPWLSIILGLGLVAAAMSTIDTCAHVASLSLSHDLLEPLLQNKKGPVKRDTVARWIAAFTVLLSMIYAFFTDSLWDIFYLSSGILTTTVFLPIVAVFLPGTHPRQVNITLASGFMSTIVFYFLEKYGFMTWQPAALAETGLGYIFWGFIAAFIVFAVVGGRNLQTVISYSKK